MKNRRVKIVLGIAGIFIVLVTFTTLGYLCRLPKNCEALWIESGCIKFETDNLTIPYQNNEIHMTFSVNADSRLLAMHLRTMACEETDDVITDIQYIRFSFFGKDGEERERWDEYIAYDFYQNKLYTLKNGKWYTVKMTKKIESYINSFLGYELIFPKYWRGQSTYAHEEFIDSDFEHPTFRYHLNWMVTVDEEMQKKYCHKSANFKNTDPVLISTSKDALLRAAQEMGYENPVGIVFYDETCGYWLVELYNSTGETWENLNDHGDFLHRNVYTVIMNNKGITLETYLDVTRYRPFWENKVITAE